MPFLKKGNSTSPASSGRLWPRYEEDRIGYVLFIILLVYVIFWMGTLIRNNLQKYNRIGRVDLAAPTVTVEGLGTVRAAPNIASVQVGLVSEGKDVATVQTENTTKMNALLAELKRIGVPDADLQTTSFSINPRYDFKDGRSSISGFEVSQSVNVKIRDLSKLGAVFAKAGAFGANQVYGPTFTIDDEESLMSSARAEAVEQARRKLLTISRDLNVRPIRLVGFAESSMKPPVVSHLERFGIGGAESTPTIQPGEVDITVSVSITYEVQ